MRQHLLAEEPDLLVAVRAPELEHHVRAPCVTVLLDRGNAVGRRSGDRLALVKDRVGHPFLRREAATGFHRFGDRPDLILLDIMMPKLDGYAVCTELRRLSNPVPVLMLTAKGQVEDRVTGLDAGADDYLVKPFSTEELLARVRALLRRVQRQTRAPAKLRLGEVEIDLVRQTARRGRKMLQMTAKEFSMLRLLAETPGEPISRERFLDVVWGYAAFPTTRTVDNHIASLRSKIERNPDEPRWIKTVHGVGYKLDL